MLKRLVLLSVALLFLQCLGGEKVQAQTANPCFGFTTWWFGDAIPPGWFYSGAYPGAWVFVIAGYNGGTNCVSRAAQAETQANSPCCGSPISLATGNTYIDEIDLSIPGLGGGLLLRRRWNSAWPLTQISSSVGIFGPNWRSTYEERIFTDSNTNLLKYSRSDGSYWTLGLNPTGALVVAAPATVSATLSQNASSWVLAFQNGEQRQFSLLTGLLTAIIDRNGNTTQVTYDSLSRLTTVTDPAGQQLTFNYASGSSYWVTSVTSNFGVTLSYAYDSSYRLSVVTKPDLTTITFTYNSQSQITQVTDSDGIVLETHTYDSYGHGLTSAQANGVNSLTITYPPTVVPYSNLSWSLESAGVP